MRATFVHSQNVYSVAVGQEVIANGLGGLFVLPAAAGDDRLETLFLSRLPMWMMGTCIEGTPFQSLKGECMRLAAVSTGPN